MKSILNNTARPFNLKPTCSKTGKHNITLIPGLNMVSPEMYKLLKGMKYCKELAEEDILIFSPKKRIKDSIPVSTPKSREVKDPETPLGSGGTKKKEAPEALEDDGSDDSEYQEYLKGVDADKEEALDYQEWLEEDDE